MENKPRKSKVFLIAMAICLGAVTLGAGLSAGYVIATHFLPSANESIAPVQPESITSVRINPFVVPIDPFEADFVDVISEVKDAVVSISIGASSDLDEDVGAGSGFIFYVGDEFVFVATNNHVVDGAARISISLDDNESLSAIVVETNSELDLAVLVVSLASIEEKGSPFAVLDFGDSDLMRIGDTVVAIGNAMGEGQTVTKGIISALDIDIVINEPRSPRLELNVLQTDAAVNRGNSGGPLINRDGEVIGIVTAKQIGSGIEGMGYALPSNNVFDVLMEMKSAQFSPPAFIGIEFIFLNAFEAGLFNLPAAGVLVQGIIENSPAERAGLIGNDFIVSVDGIAIAGIDEMLSQLSPGQEAVFGVYRQGERIEVPIVLGSRM